MSRSLRSVLVATLALVSTAAAAPRAEAQVAPGLSREQIQRTIQGVALLTPVTVQGEEIVPVGVGSGTVITADGSILTNAHVLKTPDGELAPAVVVSLTRQLDGSPEPTCVVFPKRSIVLDEMDLALVKCEMDLEGQAYQPHDWSFVPARTTGGLGHGDVLWVFGYPGAGAGAREHRVLPSITVTTGRVAGFVSEDGRRTWLKTDAMLSGGNSGGTAVDEEGYLVGVPTWVDTDTRDGVGTLGQVGYLRPTDMAALLINVAYKGWVPSDRS